MLFSPFIFLPLLELHVLRDIIHFPLSFNFSQRNRRSGFLLLTWDLYAKGVALSKCLRSM